MKNKVTIKQGLPVKQIGCLCEGKMFTFRTGELVYMVLKYHRTRQQVEYVNLTSGITYYTNTCSDVYPLAVGAEVVITAG